VSGVEPLIATDHDVAGPINGIADNQSDTNGKDLDDEDEHSDEDSITKWS